MTDIPTAELDRLREAVETLPGWKVTEGIQRARAVLSMDAVDRPSVLALIAAARQPEPHVHDWASPIPGSGRVCWCGATQPEPGSCRCSCYPCRASAHEVYPRD